LRDHHIIITTTTTTTNFFFSFSSSSSSFSSSFMQSIYTYIPKANYVPREYNVAAIL
jgi:hypothetical protein